MTNRFYNETFTAAMGSLARSRAIDVQLERITTAFALVQAELDAWNAGIVANFTDLADVPQTLTGNALKMLRVNVAATAIEFVALPSGTMPIVNVSASRALTNSDMGCNLLCDSESAITLTFPLQATTEIPVESLCVITQWGAGQVTLAPEGAAVLRSSGALLKTRVQFAQVTAMKVDTDEWLIGGDRGA